MWQRNVHEVALRVIGVARRERGSMADGSKSSDVPGFTEGEDGVFADANGDTSGDYSNWDWKHIMAAITGGAAYTGSDLEQKAAGYSNPLTVQNAANTFWYVQEVLKEVGDDLVGLAESVTGENGFWKGEAATAFSSAISGLGRQTLQMADVLSGGVTGDNNVPQQLANNAQHLYEAIAKVKDIDNWYAKEAARIDPDLVMSNGLVRVSANEKIVKMMTDDMRQVLVALAKHYKINKDSISQPTSPSNPATTGGTPATTGGTPTATGDYSTTGYNGATGNASGSGSGYGGAGNGYGGAGNGYAGSGNGYGGAGSGYAGSGSGYAGSGSGYAGAGNGYGGAGNGYGGAGNGYGGAGNGYAGSGNGYAPGSQGSQGHGGQPQFRMAVPAPAGASGEQQPGVLYERQPALTPEEQQAGVAYDRQPAVTSGEQQPGVLYERQPAVTSGEQQPGVLYERQPALTPEEQQAGVAYDRQPAVTSGEQQPGVLYDRQPALTPEEQQAGVAYDRQPAVTSGEQQPG
ncbi:hypothetical protein, partial [Streptomyces sp. NPDC001348]